MASHYVLENPVSLVTAASDWNTSSPGSIVIVSVVSLKAFAGKTYYQYNGFGQPGIGPFTMPTGLIALSGNIFDSNPTNEVATQ